MDKIKEFLLPVAPHLIVFILAGVALTFIKGLDVMVSITAFIAFIFFPVSFLCLVLLGSFYKSYTKFISRYLIVTVSITVCILIVAILNFQFTLDGTEVLFTYVFLSFVMAHICNFLRVALEPVFALIGKGLKIIIFNAEEKEKNDK